MFTPEEVQQIRDIVREVVEEILEEKLDQKLEEKLEEKLKPMRTDISQFKDEVNKRFDEVNKQLAQLDDYVWQYATGIEKEITLIMKEHYREHIRKDVQFKSFPIKKLHDFDGNMITDFDYVIAALHPNNLPEHEKNDATSHNKYDLIVVEAKHHISLLEILRKIQQIFAIRCVLSKLETSDETKFHKHFKNDMTTLIYSDLDLKNCVGIYFYVGGPTWDDDARAFFDKIRHKSSDGAMNLNIGNFRSKLSLTEQNDIISYLQSRICAITPTGNRYRVLDHASIGGGAKRTKNYKMKTLL